MKAYWMILMTAVLMFAGNASAAEKLVEELKWDKASEHVELVPPAMGSSCLKVHLDTLTPFTQIILKKIAQPKIGATRYALVGEMKHEIVAGSARLEMWSARKDGGDESKAWVTGDAYAPIARGIWRPFKLVSNSKPGSPPTSLTFSILLLTRTEGTVWIRNVKLVEMPSPFGKARDGEELDWNTLPQGVELIPPAMEPACIKVRAEDGGRTVTLKEIEKPKLSSIRYVLEGEVKSDGVKGAAYLEMWNNFADGGHYFSRTLGNEGPMASISGTNDWRKFSLPFFSKPDQLPTSLVFNAVLPGEGTLWVRNVRLIEDSTGRVQSAGGWWSKEQALTFIAIYAGTILAAGAVVGILLFHGRGRKAAMGIILGMWLSGFVAIVIAIAAISSKQPSYVSSFFLLGGMLVFFPVHWAKHRFNKMELARLMAMDAR